MNLPYFAWGAWIFVAIELSVLGYVYFSNPIGIYVVCIDEHHGQVWKGIVYDQPIEFFEPCEFSVRGGDANYKCAICVDGHDWDITHNCGGDPNCRVCAVNRGTYIPRSKRKT